MSTGGFDLATAASIVDRRVFKVDTSDQGANSIVWIGGGTAFGEFAAAAQEALYGVLQCTVIIFVEIVAVGGGDDRNGGQR